MCQQIGILSFHHSLRLKFFLLFLFLNQRSWRARKAGSINTFSIQKQAVVYSMNACLLFFPFSLQAESYLGKHNNSSILLFLFWGLRLFAPSFKRIKTEMPSWPLNPWLAEVNLIVSPSCIQFSKYLIPIKCPPCIFHPLAGYSFPTIFFLKWLSFFLPIFPFPWMLYNNQTCPCRSRLKFCFPSQLKDVKLRVQHRFDHVPQVRAVLWCRNAKVIKALLLLLFMESLLSILFSFLLSVNI